MHQIPLTPNVPVVRTDFSDEDVWQAIQKEIVQPMDGFVANVDFVDNLLFEGLIGKELLRRIPATIGHSFIIVADRLSMTDKEHTVLVVDLVTEPGREFRSEPSQVQSIENNLSISNMDFAEFANECDPEGVFRGFPSF